MVSRTGGPGNPGLVRYVETLTREQLLIAARQGCEAVVNDPRYTEDWERTAAAASNAAECVIYYLDKAETGEHFQALLDIVGDETEPPGLREAVIGQMTVTPHTAGIVAFQAYVEPREDVVYALLYRIIDDREEAARLRRQASGSLSRMLGKRYSTALLADANLRAAKQTATKAVRSMELVRSGAVTLEESTVHALEPVEALIYEDAERMGRILACPEEEPEFLRQHAQRVLQGYERLPLKNPERIDAILSGADLPLKRTRPGGQAPAHAPNDTTGAEKSQR